MRLQYLHDRNHKEKHVGRDGRILPCRTFPSITANVVTTDYSIRCPLHWLESIPICKTRISRLLNLLNMHHCDAIGNSIYTGLILRIWKRRHLIHLQLNTTLPGKPFVPLSTPNTYQTDFSGILVPGGFGTRGTEGMIAAAKWAREQKIPYFGICLGLQTATIEFARNVVGIQGTAP